MKVANPMIDQKYNGVVQWSFSEVVNSLFVVEEDDAWYQLRANQGADRYAIICGHSNDRGPTIHLPLWLEIA